MAFDAGSIDAKLTVKLDEFNASMDRAEGRVKQFERDEHKVRLSAVFDQSSMARARKMFSDLDTAISKDAMTRLRSSPQGSVLGSLNALFSPHPVSGAPTPAQSAGGGLLGKMISGTGSGGGAGDDLIRQVITGAAPGNVSTKDLIERQLTGAAPGNVSTKDIIARQLTGNAPGDVNTTDKIRQVLTGTGPGDTSTTDTIREKLDPKSTGDVERAAENSGGRAGGRWTIGFGSRLGPFFGSFQKQLGGAGNTGGAALGKGLLAGIGPGILGISAKMSGMSALVGTGLAALPAVAGLAGTGIGVALIAGITGIVAKGAIASVQPLVAAYNKLQTAAPGPAQVAALAAYNRQLALMSPAQRSLAKSLEGMQAAWQNFIKSNVTGVATIVTGGIGLLPGIISGMNGVFRAVVPQMKAVFGALGGVINGLLGVAKTAVPAFAPFITAILRLVTDILPGLDMIIKATIPFMGQFAGVAGALGKNLGGLFTALAPAVGASMKVLTLLLGVVGQLLPVIGQVADVFAVGLGPAIGAVAGVLKSLMPPLVTVAKVIASFAGAVIADLVAAFTAVATLVKAAAPGLNILAKALGGVFTVLENSGVFAILGNALENLAGPLGALVTALAEGLAPILPPVVKFIGDLAALLASTLSGAVVAVLPSLTKLAVTVLGALAKILPPVLPLITKLAATFSAILVNNITQIIPPLITLATTVLGQLAGLLPVVVPVLATMVSLLTPVWARIIGDIAQALAAIISAVPASVLTGIALAIGAIVLGIKAWAIGQAILNFALDANPIGVFVLAVGALVVAIVELVDHWSAVWGAVKRVAADAWNFIYNGFGKYLLPLLGPAGAIILAAIEVQQHWGAIWGAVQDAFTTVVQAILAIWRAVPAPVKAVLSTIEGAVKTAWAAIRAVTKAEWDAIAGVLKAVWAVISGAFKVAIALLTGNWTAANNAMKTTGTQVWNAIRTALGQIWNAIGGLARAAWAAMEGAAHAAWNSMLATARAVWGTIVAFFQGVPGRIVAALSALGGDMITVGKQAIAGLLGGITGALRGIAGWVNSNIVQPIIGAVKSFFGISSPSTVMAGIGSHLVGGLIKGLVTSAKGIGSIVKKVFGDMPHALLSMLEKGIGGITSLPGKAVSALKALGGDALGVLESLGSIATGIWDSIFGGGSGGGGVAQWKGVVDKALAMLGLSQGLEHNVLYQMQTESGGNPRAINLTDSNAAAGDPSRGLMQVIGGTFAAYHVPGTSMDIYDPLANTAAAINYARARYGPTLMSGGMGIGSGHGYALGGPINEMVIGYGVGSGARYTFGERGPEYVTPGGKPPGDSAALLAKLDQLIAVARQIPAGVGDQVGGAIGDAAHAASFRSRYPRGGA